jgi:hypothetical protein
MVIVFVFFVGLKLYLARKKYFVYVFDLSLLVYIFK